MLNAGVEVDVCVRGGPPRRKVWIVERLRDHDIDPAKRVNHLPKGLEIDGDPVVHPLARYFGHGGRRQVAPSRRTSPIVPNVWETLPVYADRVGQVDPGGDRPLVG